MPLDSNSNKTDPPRGPDSKAKSFGMQFGQAMELPFVLAGAIAVGGLVGYFLDRWLHTKLIFTVVLGGLGFYAGLCDVLRRLSASDNGKD